MPQQISETSDRHRSKDVVSDTEERAECTWPQPDAMLALKELCHEIYRNSEGTATRLSETLKQPLKKLKEDVTNIANTKKEGQMDELEGKLKRIAFFSENLLA